MKQSVGMLRSSASDPLLCRHPLRGCTSRHHREAQNKRWVLVAPPGSTECRGVVARAVGAEQLSRVGNQTGGRVFLFLHTDDFWRDFELYRSRGVEFVREPKEESYRNRRGVQGPVRQPVGLVAAQAMSAMERAQLEMTKVRAMRAKENAS